MQIQKDASSLNAPIGQHTYIVSLLGLFIFWTINHKCKLSLISCSYFWKGFIKNYSYIDQTGFS